MKPDEITAIVTELNQELFEKIDRDTTLFVYSSTGYVDFVEFAGVVLWRSDEDERDYLDEEEVEDLEPLQPFLRRMAGSRVRELSKSLAIAGYDAVSPRKNEEWKTAEEE